MSRAFVAMSGGVDSTACAVLLLRQGYAVSGITMDLGFGDAAERAAQACRALGIEHHVVPMRELFSRRVISPFCGQYLSARTPNPCVMCNREIKFGALFDEAVRLGAEYFATGHYARIERISGGFALKKALDPKKDQSYVLYNLNQLQLSRVLFPLGSLNKAQARGLARRCGSDFAKAAESQDICFVPDGDYAAFIARFTGSVPPPGDFTDTRGQKLGRHGGIIHYTIGQRRGLGVAAERPLYVLGKDAERNTVTLGFEDELMYDVFEAEELCWTFPFDGGAPKAPLRASVRTRYHQEEIPCLVTPLPGSRARIEPDSPVRAPAPGQSAVLYDGETVLGGGIII